MTGNGSEVLPISLVLHTTFCHRRTWLEANDERTDTFQMQAGHSAHRRVDDPGTSRPRQLRSVPLISEELGIIGRADVLEPDESDGFRLIEYKATPLRRTPQVTEANVLQLALQKACLEESGRNITGCAVRFLDHNRTVDVDITPEIEEKARDTVIRTREIIGAAVAPAPLIDDSRCSRCSHIDVCLPDERRGERVRRRIHAADPDGQVLHLTEPGSRASVRAGKVVVTKRGEKLGEVPLERVHGVTVHGNVDLSGALLRELLWRDQSIVWCSSTGRVYGWGQPTRRPNGLARAQQHIRFQAGHDGIAREMISAKIANQGTLLRRNAKVPEQVARLRTLQMLVREAEDQRAVFGFEGEAAHIYFSAFGAMLKPHVREDRGYTWQGRVGRGATDPINILLNYAYGMLSTECARALLSCGLDPHAGVLHSSSRNKPALALDLMEEFRPLIADSVVVSVLNRKELPSNAFTEVEGARQLTKAGRQALIRSFEKRIATEFTHPVFGYKITWRRAIEVQARMILGVLDGSQTEYRGVTTR